MGGPEEHDPATDLHILSGMAKDMGVLPLPPEVYPRIMEKRIPDRGYYIALGLVMAIWMITPASCAYLLYYTLFARHSSLTGTLFAGYAITEVLFAIYQQYLIRFVQAPAPPSDISLELKHSLFIKVLQAGLAYPEPQPPRHPLAYDGQGEPPQPRPEDWAEYERQLDIFAQYNRGLLTKGQYHHLIDVEYEKAIGMQEARRVARSTKQEREVVQAFVEDEAGEREERLRREVERDVNEAFDNVIEDGVLDKDGNVIRLHAWDKRAIELRERLRTWFDHAPWSSLRRDNVLHWLSFACFNLPLSAALSYATHTEFLMQTYDIIEARTGTVFPPGFDPAIRTIRLTLDPVIARSRPLVLYALSNTANWFIREVWLPYKGMGHYVEGGVEYLVRIPPGWTPEKGRRDPKAMPVVYLHGLGFGLLQNRLLVEHILEALPTHPVLLPLAHHTAQALFHPRFLSPWTRPEFVDCLKRICEQWGFWEEPQAGESGGGERWGGVSMLSHSNGSVAHGWVLKDCPSLVRRSTFVDPVVFCIWEGDLCHSFCYRKPATAIELLLYYFIATEVGTSHYIQRHFDWATNTLFIDELPHLLDPATTQIFLGGKDIIVDAKRVRQYLEHHGMKVGQGLWWDDHGGHGDGLSGESRERVVRFVGTGSVWGWEGHVGRFGREASGKGAGWSGSGSGEDSDRTAVDEDDQEDKKTI